MKPENTEIDWNGLLNFFKGLLTGFAVAGFLTAILFYKTKNEMENSFHKPNPIVFKGQRVKWLIEAPIKRITWDNNYGEWRYWIDAGLERGLLADHLEKYNENITKTMELDN